MREQEMKTLSEWLKSNGYEWIDGRERMYKAMLTTTSAQLQMSQLLQEGAIRHV